MVNFFQDRQHWDPQQQGTNTSSIATLAKQKTAAFVQQKHGDMQKMMGQLNIAVNIMDA